MQDSGRRREFPCVRRGPGLRQRARITPPSRVWRAADSRDLKSRTSPNEGPPRSQSPRPRAYSTVYRLNLKNGALELGTTQKTRAMWPLGRADAPIPRPLPRQIATSPRAGHRDSPFRADQQSALEDLFSRSGPEEILNLLGLPPRMGPNRSILMSVHWARQPPAVVEKKPLGRQKKKVLAVSDEG